MEYGGKQGRRKKEEGRREGHGLEAGTIVLSFDNVIDDPMNIKINVDQVGLGRTAGNFLLKETTGDVDFLIGAVPGAGLLRLTRAPTVTKQATSAPPPYGCSPRPQLA